MHLAGDFPVQGFTSANPLTASNMKKARNP